MGPYTVEIVIINKNYITLKLNTDKTQFFQKKTSPKSKNLLHWSLFKATNQPPRSNQAVTSSKHSSIYKPLYGNQNSEIWYFTIHQHIVTLASKILVKVVFRHQAFSLHNFVIIFVKIILVRKLALLVTHFQKLGQEKAQKDNWKILNPILFKTTLMNLSNSTIQFPIINPNFPIKGDNPKND